MAQKITNFGRNLSFTPDRFLRPGSETDLLEELSQTGSTSIRCFGSRHAWSPLIESSETAISLENFSSTELVNVNGEQRVRVGAGCRIKDLVRFLNQHNLTLPTLGLIDEQTVAGATATGTHGSGSHSLSHFIQAVKLVHYDAALKEWKAEWIRDDAEDLMAARCSLGALGVITQIEFPVREQYNVEEHFTVVDHLDDVLSSEPDYPIQQFFLLPWRWDFFVQHRRTANEERSRLAPLYRLFWLAGMDFGMHLMITALGKFLPWGSSRLCYRFLLGALVPRRWKIVDRSDRQLTMQHDLFRHIEIEVFVARSKLPEMLRFAREHIEKFARHPKSCRYEHHYPICVRKILNDATLISPASGGDEPWYSVSFISYNRVSARTAFLDFASTLAETAAARFEARPHWGKICPLAADDLGRLYPQMSDFLRVLRKYDPAGRFQNPWLREILPMQNGD